MVDIFNIYAKTLSFKKVKPPWYPHWFNAPQPQRGQRQHHNPCQKKFFQLLPLASVPAIQCFPESMQVVKDLWTFYSLKNISLYMVMLAHCNFPAGRKLEFWIVVIIGFDSLNSKVLNTQHISLHKIDSYFVVFSKGEIIWQHHS